MDRVLVDRQELERLKAMEKKLILEQKMKELTAVDYPNPPKSEPIPAVSLPISESQQALTSAPANNPLFFQSQKSEIENQKNKDIIETKIEQVMEMQDKKQQTFFKKPFIKKNIPPSQAQEKFDKWLQESCKNNCFICADCEKRLREIINEGWVWFQQNQN